VGEGTNVFERIRARGGEFLQQLAGELMKNEHFVKAVQGAARGREKLDGAVGRALKTLNVPTRSDLKKIHARLEALEAEVAALRPARKAAAKRRAK
jgi:hypothetical protein